MMEKVIEVSHLTKEYKNLKAIDDLSFNVYQGEILGLLGPNGCGKSTTINSILSLLKYQEGFIKVFGKEMKPDSYDLKAKIGVIFQEVAVFDELNVYDNINYFCGLYIRARRGKLFNLVRFCHGVKNSGCDKVGFLLVGRQLFFLIHKLAFKLKNSVFLIGQSAFVLVFKREYVLVHFGFFVSLFLDIELHLLFLIKSNYLKAFSASFHTVRPKDPLCKYADL